MCRWKHNGDWGWGCSGNEHGERKFVLTAGSVVTNAGMDKYVEVELAQMNAGDTVVSWTVAAYVGGIAKTSAQRSFTVCVSGKPGAVTLLWPSGMIGGEETTFQWQISSWGHVCGGDVSDLVFELYIQASGQDAKLFGSCLAVPRAGLDSKRFLSQIRLAGKLASA